MAGEFDPTVFKCGGQQRDISCQSNVNTADYAVLLHGLRGQAGSGRGRGGAGYACAIPSHSYCSSSIALRGLQNFSNLGSLTRGQVREFNFKFHVEVAFSLFLEMEEEIK